MGNATVKKSIPAPADKLWALVADFGDTSWMPGGGGSVEVQGSGPGMARIINAGDTKIREVLETCNAAERTLVYTIPEGVPFPVENYRSTMTVTGDENGSELEWTCSFEPNGATDAEATAMIEGMYGTMIGWISDTVSGG